MKLSEMNQEQLENYVDFGDYCDQDVIDLYKDLTNQKTITELAVACLQRIDSIRETFPIRFQPRHVEAALIKVERLAADTLSEIERLSQ